MQRLRAAQVQYTGHLYDYYINEGKRGSIISMERADALHLLAPTLVSMTA